MKYILQNGRIFYTHFNVSTMYSGRPSLFDRHKYRVVRFPKIFVSRHRSASESWSCVRCTGTKFLGHLKFILGKHMYLVLAKIDKIKCIQGVAYFSWSSTICSDVIGRLSGKTFIIKFFTFFCFDIFSVVAVVVVALAVNWTSAPLSLKTTIDATRVQSFNFLTQINVCLNSNFEHSNHSVLFYYHRFETNSVNI